MALIGLAMVPMGLNQRMRMLLCILGALGCSTVHAADDAAPRDPCISTPLILVRGMPQHLETTEVEVRSFLSRETGDSPPDDAQYFEVKAPTSVVRSLRYLRDTGGGLILPQVACESRVPFNDAEADQYMRNLFAKLQLVRTLPATAHLIEFGPDEGLDQRQSEQPVPDDGQGDHAIGKAVDEGRD